MRAAWAAGVAAGLLVSAASAAECTYGGAPGVMQNGWCRPIPGGVLVSKAAKATCGVGWDLVVQGSHRFVCVKPRGQ